ncbi:hypothetical protein NDU88_008271 [Pleurodeles waltl]|uniref:Uncharacterized protein n=1 Tax=Pleurodeles waltl TaxID=8319 RepID=A0AAV7QU84_PLEWA|nr:hypothetical protein NDU88_008271 [Pleurodeles waltl]
MKEAHVSFEEDIKVEVGEQLMVEDPLSVLSHEAAIAVDVYYEPLRPVDMDALASGFMGSGSNIAVTTPAVSPSVPAEVAGFDHVCSLEIASEAMVDVLSAVAGYFLDTIEFGHGNMLGASLTF